MAPTRRIRQGLLERLFATAPIRDDELARGAETAARRAAEGADAAGEAAGGERDGEESGDGDARPRRS